MRWLLPPLVFSAALAAHAATYTWTGAAGDGQYVNSANWLGNSAPPNNGTASLVFGNSGAGTVTLPLLLNVSDLQFTHTTGSYTFNASPGALLTLRNGLSTSGGTTLLNNNLLINFAGAQTVTTSNGSSLTLAGPLLGNGTLIKAGTGTLTLTGLNVTTGGTRVTTGTLVFTQPAAISPFGQIESNPFTYVAVTFTSNLQASLINRLDPVAFTGTIGLDAPLSGGSSNIISENLDLSAVQNLGGLGTNSVVRLTGNLTVAPGADYRFGGGTGILTLSSNLSANGDNVSVTSLHGTPLSLVLQGNNAFAGDLNITRSVVRLDSAHALPSTSSLNLLGPGYVGSTENLNLSAPGLLGRLGRITSPEAIVGFDSANFASPRNVTDALDLSQGGTRLDPYYLGTSTKATLSGTLTPTVGDGLYFTTVRGGELTVASTLTPNIPSVTIGQTNPFDPQTGTVKLTGNNSYTGGTRVLGGTAIAGSNTAFGTGLVNVSSGATLSTAPNTTLSNPLALHDGARLSGIGTFATPGGIVIQNGSILSPNTSTQVGTLRFSTDLTFGSGGQFDFNIINALPTASGSWDKILLPGNTLSLGADPANPFVINLITLSGSNNLGAMSNFDPAHAYSWTFASAANITGFNANEFSFNTSSFANNLGGGSFFLGQNGNSLTINFTPVPEPSTYALLALGLGALAFTEYRRRKR